MCKCDCEILDIWGFEQIMKYWNNTSRLCEILATLQPTFWKFNLQCNFKVRFWIYPIPFCLDFDRVWDGRDHFWKILIPSRPVLKINFGIGMSSIVARAQPKLLVLDSFILSQSKPQNKTLQSHLAYIYFTIVFTFLTSPLSARILRLSIYQGSFGPTNPRGTKTLFLNYTSVLWQQNVHLRNSLHMV